MVGTREEEGGRKHQAGQRGTWVQDLLRKAIREQAAINGSPAARKIRLAPEGRSSGGAHREDHDRRAAAMPEDAVVRGHADGRQQKTRDLSRVVL